MRFVIPLLFLTSPLFAADLTVVAGGSIQDQIDLAAPGDRVLVPAGVYVETIDFDGKAVTVLALAGPGSTIINGAGASPVVRFANGEGAASLLQGFTVTGGSASFGAGGVSCGTGTTPTLRDCIIRGNTGKRGAGVSGDPTMERCVVTANTSSLNHGGGIFGAPVLRDCVVAMNTCTSADGGGLYVFGGNAVVEDSLFLDNRAVFANSHGGGIYVDSTGNLDIRNSVVAGSLATGGVFAGYGAGLRVESSGSTMINCTVVQNTATGSSVSGGGIMGPLLVLNSIVAANSGGQVSGASISYSNVEGGYPGIGNVNLAPGFVDESGRDLHLRAGSNMIDMGSPLTFDADGSVADLGAFAWGSLYLRKNVTAGSWDVPTWTSIPADLGGRATMRLSMGSTYGMEPYFLLGSISGTSPGLNALGLHLPLNMDGYTSFTLSHPNSPILMNSAGLLDPMGLAEATVWIPAVFGPGLAGLTLHHAAVVGSTSAAVPLAVTNAVASPIL